MIDFIFTAVFLAFVSFLCWGLWRRTQDEQALWEARKDYKRMRKEVEKNDSSRIG
jgi:predicted negative regulator of RcsB-dependent stress response